MTAFVVVVVVCVTVVDIVVVVCITVVGIVEAAVYMLFTQVKRNEKREDN